MPPFRALPAWAGTAQAKRDASPLAFAASRNGAPAPRAVGVARGLTVVRPPSGAPRGPGRPRLPRRWGGEEFRRRLPIRTPKPQLVGVGRRVRAVLRTWSIGRDPDYDSWKATPLPTLRIAFCIPLI